VSPWVEENVAEFGLTYFNLSDKRQGIVHIIGPEQGFTLPGTTVVCGDSHTATHGAFGRGLRSSTSRLNLSRFCFKVHPTYFLIPSNTPETPPLKKP
jgi:hypothetical protein